MVFVRCARRIRQTRTQKAADKTASVAMADLDEMSRQTEKLKDALSRLLA